jgi:hypothetical protein
METLGSSNVVISALPLNDRRRDGKLPEFGKDDAFLTVGSVSFLQAGRNVRGDDSPCWKTDGGDAGEAMRRDAWRVRHGLLLLALAILLTSLAPGTVTGSWAEVVAELKRAASFHVEEPVVVTILERLATFLPLGTLAYRALYDRHVGPARLVACVGVLLFASAVELAQLAIQERHARLSDLILALAFGAGGVQIGAWLTERPSTAKVRRLLLAAVIGGNAIVAIIVTQSYLGAALVGWDCRYPLLVANEVSGDRPWLGRIRGLALYPRALIADEIGSLARLPLSPDNIGVRREMGALALYSFAVAGSGRVPQLLEDGSRLDLLLPAAGSLSWQVEAGALTLRDPLLIESAGPAREICEAIMGAKAFAVEVEIASGDVEQGGPARIVSQSSGILRRNFMLGEESGGLVVRVRTPSNGPDGSRLPLVTDPGVLSEGWHQVVFGYAGGAVFLALDGVQIERLPYHAMMLLGDGRGIRIAAVAALLFVAMGAITALLPGRRSWPVDAAWVYGASALLPVLIALGLAAWLGHAQDRLFFAAAAGGPGIGMLAARTLTRWRRMTAAVRAPRRPT